MNEKIKVRKGGVQYFVDDAGKLKNSFEFHLFKPTNMNDNYS